MSQIVNNYAQALIRLAEEKGLTKTVRNLSENFLKKLNIKEVILFLNHPSIKPGDKKGLLLKLLPEDTIQEFKNFLCVVIDRHQEKHLPKILEKVVDLAIQAEGFEIITLISAQVLPENEQKKILQNLEERWSTKIYLRYRENPSLLGGLVIQRGDKLYDGSLAGQLKQLREMMISETPSL